MIRLIAAIDARRGLADDQGIPWQGRLPTDAAYFRSRTAEGLVVMGFKTYEEFAKPLHDRTNYVASRSTTTALRPGFEVVADLDRFLADHRDEVVWVIGGAALYEAALPEADELVITQLEHDFHCTKFFPRFDHDFHVYSGSPAIDEGGISFRFQTWRRNRAAE
jgi:dihydrofolate reductase